MTFMLPPNSLKHTHSIFHASDALGMFMLAKFRNRWADKGLRHAATIFRKMGIPVNITMAVMKSIWPIATNEMRQITASPLRKVA